MTSRVRFYHRNNTYCKPKEVIRVCLQKITLTFSHVCKEILIAEEAAFFMIILTWSLFTASTLI